MEGVVDGIIDSSMDGTVDGDTDRVGAALTVGLNEGATEVVGATLTIGAGVGVSVSSVADTCCTTVAKKMLTGKKYLILI